MRQLLLAEFLIKGTEPIGFTLLEGTTPGFGGEAYDGIDVLRLGSEELLLEFRSAAHDRLTQRLAKNATRLDEITRRVVELDLQINERRVRFQDLLRGVRISKPLTPA